MDDEFSRILGAIIGIFTTDYPSNEYKRTREAIRRKLDGLLLNPTFRRLCTGVFDCQRIVDDGFSVRVQVSELS